MNSLLGTFDKLFVSRILLILSVVFFGLFISSVINPSPAQAAEVSCSSLAPCLSAGADLVVTGSDNTGGGGGLGGGGTGGGGTGTPSAPVQECLWTNNSEGDLVQYCDDRYKTDTEWYPFDPGIKDTIVGSDLPFFTCGPKMINGFKVSPEGVIFVTPWKLVWFGENGDPHYTQQAIQKVCVYPSSVTNVSPLKKCIINYTAAFDRSANSRLGYAARVKNISQTITTKEDIIRDPANCKTSYSANVNYSPPTNQNAWGQYSASSQISYVECQTATTSFDGATNAIAKCGNQRSMPGAGSKLTIWCAGFTPAHIQKDWSAADCYSTGAYSCKIPTPATYNGISGTVQGIRDGKNSTVQWGQPVLSAGIRNSSNWKTLTNVNKGSTPYNGSYGANDQAKQLFRSDNVTFGTWMGGGQRLSQNLAFYTASNSGSPFSMTRDYKYDAQFLVKTAKINTYDITTGAINASNISTWVPDVNVPCGPQGSPKINVIRAVGDIVG